jgi:hypothetical protein
MIRISFFRSTIILISAVATFSSCLSPRIDIDRAVVPSERYDIEKKDDGTSIARSFSVDASLKAVTAEDWALISSSEAYQPGRGMNTEAPSCFLFYYVIKNRSKMPISDFSFEIFWNGKTIPALSPADFRKRFFGYTDGGPAPDIFRFRRLITNSLSLKDIDLEKDTIGYSFKFVLPEDSVTGLTAFYELPPEARSFQVRLLFSDGGVKKIVAFDMHRTEDRQDMPEKRK